MGKLTKLEGLRGFCAVYVIIYHTYSYYRPLVIGGVDLTFLTKFGEGALISFFVLSGIVIAYTYEQSKDQSFKLYFAKRFFRIYIPLICVYILNYILFSIKYDTVSLPWEYILGNLLQLQDIQREGVHTVVPPLMMNDPLWSLSYEWWFYMLYFFIMKYFRKYSTEVAVSLFTLGSIGHLVYPNTFTRILMLMSIWWFGVIIARLYMKGERITLKPMLLPILGLTICTGSVLLNMYLNTIGVTSIYPSYDLKFLGNTYIVLLVAYLWYRARWIFYDRIFNIFIPFAGITYAFYEIHWFMICWATYLENIIPNHYVRYLAYILIAVLCAYIIEKIIYPRLNKFFMSRLFPNRLVRKN